MTQITHTLLTTDHVKRTFTYEFGGLVDLETLPFPLADAREKFPDKVATIISQTREIPAPMTAEGKLDLDQLARLVMWWAHVAQETAKQVVAELPALLNPPKLDLIEVMAL